MSAYTVYSYCLYEYLIILSTGGFANMTIESKKKKEELFSDKKLQRPLGSNIVSNLAWNFISCI